MLRKLAFSTCCFLIFSATAFSQESTTTLLLERTIERLLLPAIPNSQTFIVRPTVVGQRYAIQLSGYDQQAYQISSHQGGTLQRGDQYYYELQATAEQLSFTLQRRVGWDEQNNFRLSIANLSALNQQSGEPANHNSSTIIVTPDDDAQQLVDAIFRNNSCFNTSNHSFTGVSGFWPPFGGVLSQLGTFSNGDMSIGIDQGVVLTNGSTHQIGQANNTSFTGYSYSFLPSSIQDPDLLTLSGGVPLYDVAILEFDFTPTTDFINFNYVFASDEYCELQDVFNDVFAFLISGPGISGPFSNQAQNIAVLPDGTPISTRAINDGNNTNLFQSNRPLTGNDICGTLPPVALNSIEFDGFTVPLTASATVLPCETYRLKLILADVNDSFYHSAVFFQRGSFVASLVNPMEPAATAENTGAANAPLEGCSDGYLIFTRVDSNITDDVAVYFNISSASTATFGVDYSMQTDSFIIPAGRLSDTLFITIFPDEEAEGVETVILQITGICNCEDNQAIFYITDPPELSLSLPSVPADCAGNFVDIAPSVTGGVGEYRFNWSDGSQDSLRSLMFQNGSQTYYLTVTDNCRQTQVDSLVVQAPDIQATVVGNYSLCEDTLARVPIVLRGGINYTLDILENGIPRSITVDNQDTLWLSYTDPTTLLLVAVAADGCPGQASGQANVSSSTFLVEAVLTHIACYGDSSGSILVNVNNQAAAYTFNWQDSDLSGFDPQHLGAGTYSLRINDTAGCHFDTFFVLTQPIEALRIDTLALQNENCRQLAALSAQINGGTAPYNFLWSDGNSADLTRENLAGGNNYTLQATDANGCVAIADFSLIDQSSSINASIVASAPLLSCAVIQLDLNAATSYANPLQYSWLSPSGDTIGSQATLNITQPGNYQLYLLDEQEGCDTILHYSVLQNIDSLALLSNDTHSLNCLIDSVHLEVTVVGYTDPVNYEWYDQQGNLLSSTTILGPITAAANFTFTARRLDNGCSSQLSFSVAEDFSVPAFVLSAPTPLSCRERLAPASAQIIENGNYTYQWTTENGQIESQADQATTMVSALGEYSVLITNTDNGCTASGQVSVTEDRSLLLPTAGANRLIPCDAPNLQLTGTASPILPSTQFRWLNAAGEPVSNTATLSTTQAGVYTLEVTHPISGCVASDQISIRREGPEQLPIVPNLSPCPEIGGSIAIGAVVGGTAPYQYFIDGEEIYLNDSPNNPGSSRVVRFLPAGFHAISVRDANGCSLLDTFQIFEQLPFEGRAEDISVRLGELATLGVTSNRDGDIGSYQWQGTEGLSCVNCPNPTIGPLESFRAFVTLTDVYGCSIRLAQSVFVDRRQLVYAPTAFSPRRPDGFNDYFTLYGDDRFVVQINYLRIFDRWGSMLFEKENLAIGDERAGWDGRFKGQLLNNITYIFSAEVQLWDGTTEQIKGAFHLIP